MTEPSTKSWDGLLGSYLKADQLQGEEETFECIEAEIQQYQEAEDPQLLLHLLRKNGEQSLKFSCNKTNAQFLKNNGCKRPKDVLTKKVTLKKVRVYSPSAKKEVDGLRICKVA